MATKKTSKKPDFEQSLKKLESIVEQLESGDLSLEKAVKQWEEGMKLRDSCEKILAKTQAKVDVLLNESGDTRPFDSD
ncbi:MAG: exodeoxyribonuclease VII small subunit [Pseudomonadota bacterium]